MISPWWASKEWRAYERAYGDEPGARARLLESAPWRTRIVDLSQDEAALWRGVRTSYHALINRLARIYDPSDPNVAVIQRQTRAIFHGPGAGGLIRTAQRVHLLDAGRKTRPDETWDLMGDWADECHGLFSMAFDYDARSPEMEGWPPCVGYAYFILHERWAYYASAASLRRDINIALVWWAMLALKRVGVTRCELGWQGEAADDKGRRIEFLRRGFGGDDVLVTDSRAEEMARRA